MVKPYIGWSCMYKKISLDKYLEPNHAKGALHGMSKLTDEQVHEIFKLNTLGYNQVQIGIMLNVDNTTVQYVLKGKTWKHVGIKPIKTRTNNKSGCVGVYLHKAGKWIAEIIIDGKYTRLGSFDKKEDAIKSRKNAEVLYRV
jgi:hypothetical protein